MTEKKIRKGSLEKKLQLQQQRLDATRAQIAAWDAANSAELARLDEAANLAEGAERSADEWLLNVILKQGRKLKLVAPNAGHANLGSGWSLDWVHPELRARVEAHVGLDGAALAANAHRRGNQREDLLSQAIVQIWSVFLDGDSRVAAAREARRAPAAAARVARHAHSQLLRGRRDLERLVLALERELADIQHRVSDRAPAKPGENETGLKREVELKRHVEIRKKLDELITKQGATAFLRTFYPAKAES